MVIDEELGLSLEHHGIDGQKWGHRNGPPYPLDPNKDYSKAELRALKKESRKEFRKEYRKFKKYKKKQAKEDEARKKAEAEAMIEEEKKQHAIASGSASEVDKYKDKMTTQELNDAMNRVRAFQSLESLKMSEVKSATDKINDEINRITAENNLAKAKLQEKYAPGKGEYALDKTARITDKIGKIAKNATSLGVAVKTWQGVTSEADKIKTDKAKALKEEKANKLKEVIDKAVKSGSPELVDRFKKQMTNEQYKSAVEKIDLLNPVVNPSVLAKTSNYAVNKKLAEISSNYEKAKVASLATKKAKKEAQKIADKWDAATKRINELMKETDELTGYGRYKQYDKNGQMESLQYDKGSKKVTLAKAKKGSKWIKR